MKISLSYKSEKLSKSFIKNVIRKIISSGFEVDDENPDVVLFIGGDGTFLRAVHQHLDHLSQIKFIGLCKGNLGFFYTYQEDELDVLLYELKNNLCKEEKHHLIKGLVDEKTFYALNEIRIESPFHTLISEVYIDDDYLETFRGNGLVVSTSLGSSAYNKSLGGAIVCPKICSMQLSEIAPINNVIYHSLHSSLIVDKDSEIVLKTKTDKILVGFDYFNSEIKFASSIKLRLSKKIVTILHKKDYSYTRLLNDKFVGDK